MIEKEPEIWVSITQKWFVGQGSSTNNTISWNAYQICHHESNNCYPRWMCSAWDGS